MRRLRLVGLSGDGRDVVFVDEANTECAAPADDRLRAALRGDRARLGQLEIEMDSVLRPRDIQARIRAGQTPDSVAALAQVSVDKIMPYCVPVLAEREHVASQAGRGFVRRPNAESGGGARKLSEVVAEKLRDRGLDPTTAEWDAWRRDDGRWSVQARYQSGGAEHAATFLYDAVGRYSIADDDEAKWFTGEKQATRKGPQPRDTTPRATDEADEPASPAARRLSAVPAGEDLLSLTLDVDAAAADLADAPTAVVSDLDDSPADQVFDQEAEASEQIDPEPAPERGFIESVLVPDEPVDTSDDLTAMVRAIRESMVEEQPAAEATQPEAEPVTEAREDKQRRRNGKRASVPTWDEIMFGRGADR